MSLLRKLSKSFIGFLFTVALLLTLITYSLVGFTQLDTIKNVVADLFQKAPAGTPGADFAGAESNINSIKELCQKSGLETIDMGPSLGNLLIKCSEINSVNSSNFRDFVSSTVAQAVYNKNYDCSFLDCIRRGEPVMPLIITNFAHRFYEEVLNYIIIITVVLGALFVFLAEGVKSRLKSLGFSLLWSSVPFVLLSLFTQKIVGSFIPSEVSPLVRPVIDTFFAPTFMIYVYLLVAGAALLAAGYLIKTNSPDSRKKK